MPASLHSQQRTVLYFFIIVLCLIAGTSCSGGGDSGGDTDSASHAGLDLDEKASFFGVNDAYDHDEHSYFKSITGMSQQDFYNWTDDHQQVLQFKWTSLNLLSWDSIEPELGGSYDWNDEWYVDENIIAIQRSGQVNIKLIVRALRSDVDWKNRKTEFQRFIRDSVERYDGDGELDADGSPRVEYWGAFGEVRSDGGPFYLTVDEYVQYVSWIEEAAHDADPTAKIILAAFQTEDGTMSDTLKQIIERLAASGIPFDAVDYHSWDEADSWQMEAIAEFRDFLDNLGLSDVEIWSVENGTWVGSPSSFKTQTEEDQARFLAKRYASSQSVGLDKLFWNNVVDWYDFGGDTGSIYNSMGLIGDGALNDEDPERANVARIAYHTFALLAAAIDRPENEFAGELSFDDDRLLYGYEYLETASGRKKTIVWSESISYNVGMSVNSSTVRVTNLITDADGNLQEDYTLDAVDGRVFVTVGQDPLLVEELAGG